MSAVLTTLICLILGNVSIDRSGSLSITSLSLGFVRLRGLSVEGFVRLRDLSVEGFVRLSYIYLSIHISIVVLSQMTVATAFEFAVATVIYLVTFRKFKIKIRF